jgi:hypothetical protein
MPGGKEAKQKGELAELLFEGASTTYQANGLLKWVKTFPEFVPLGRVGKLTKGYFKAASEPDYLLLTRYFGTCWVEIKYFTAKARKTYAQSLHQHEFMLEAHELGYFCAYLIMWYYNEVEVWRLYPVETIQVKAKNNGYSLIFEREKGLIVESFDGQPLYYDAIGDCLQ